MLYDLLKSRLMAVVAIALALGLCIYLSWTPQVPLWVYLAFSLPLVVNLLFCLYDHLRAGKTRGMRDWSFWLSHFAMLLIFVGALASYATRTEGYTRLVAGESFSDVPANYAYWREGYLPRKGSGMALSLKGVHTERWPNAKLKEFASTVEIRDDEGASVIGVLEVNNPFSYRGLALSVTRDYGLELLLTYTRFDGTTSGTVHVPYGKEGRFSIPGTGLGGTATLRDFDQRTLNLQLSSGGKVIREGVVGLGSGWAFQDALLQVSGVELWSGITVIHDPWRYLVYAGFILFLVTTLVYYRYRLTEQ